MASYESLGVGRVVNAAGNASNLGSASMGQEVLRAMCDAATWYVDMDELHQRAGDYIARITGAEAGLVTSGAAAGLLLATAACVTRGDASMLAELPASAAGREVIIQKPHRNGYDHAVRTAGVTLLEVGQAGRVSPEQIEAAIHADTVAILFVFGETIDRRGEVSLKDIVDIGKRRGVPIILDASVANYPFDRLQEFAALGIDLITTSGGKHIFGPPGTGFLFGRQDLMDVCRLMANPIHGIGRPLKIGKEEIVGLVTALEIYVERDVEAEHRGWETSVRTMAEALADLPHATVTITAADEVDRPVPRVRLAIDEQGLGTSAADIAEVLQKAEPSVRVTRFSLDEGVLILNPVCLLPGDEALVVQALREAWPQL
ncbi:MAG: aminotransferase class V-fold PLP-dependent enzyme [Gemmatimonadetes bacterium]|jgi:D-glucosaminate-6-phosphate ammonia-lyase|nr:aminotransferase class V-fold PLP-dependent enzyme [Gemmatimonadota bacterium]MBT5059281.1 aminotransferase class V-fold PLP-dependent enzyme [Gemmatimonadota bacterium]MBT5145531.1 aminotransferase class V-fold PLP-dependent enzyme [Gemmatimonadota bacterium]MBT5591719.1 aminotransferase class V-fold PLP-dependent enzyme [Gemmatimonadota bacterium]MBT5961826.1 aminotransferase class V-fold PLP-dependent enzyme [Gemmatimonadota bacterium]